MVEIDAVPGDHYGYSHPRDRYDGWIIHRDRWWFNLAFVEYGFNRCITRNDAAVNAIQYDHAIISALPEQPGCTARGHATVFAAEYEFQLVPI